jgi:hypothetical protein
VRLVGVRDKACNEVARNGSFRSGSGSFSGEGRESRDLVGIGRFKRFERFAIFDLDKVGSTCYLSGLFVFRALFEEM